MKNATPQSSICNNYTKSRKKEAETRQSYGTEDTFENRIRIGQFASRHMAIGAYLCKVGASFK